MADAVRTRFAPSPTGYLHIGGVRTALFNFLFARRHGGRFILRIDDTDQQRNVAEALQPILDGFRWLGIDWDEGAEVGGPHEPYYQSQKAESYQAAVRTLLEKGLAYFDYSKAEEREAEEKAARAEKRPYVYSRKWMAQTPADRARFEAEGRQGVVRLKMPREGVCRFHDDIRGDMEIQWVSEQDHVIQRADGSCLYNLANVVDDHDMEITHVIRAEEHLSNTARQIFIADGLGYKRPEYAHVPFVAEPGSKNKLSKRKIAEYLKNPDFKKVYEHGRAIAERVGLPISQDTFNPVVVDFYRQVGYLPHAVVNYLLLLGWSLDDKTEFFTRQKMIEEFSLERVNKAPASFDPQKLLAFQAHYMAMVPVEEKVELVLPYLQRAKVLPIPTPETLRAKVTAIVQAAGERIKVAGDVLDYADFFVPDDQLEYDRKALEKRLGKPGAAALLRAFRDRLRELAAFNAQDVRKELFEVARRYALSVPSAEQQHRLQQMDAVQRDTALAEVASFDPANLEYAEMRRFTEAQRIQIGDIIHSLRVAITGKSVGFGLYQGMAILGRDSCVNRINRALEKLSVETTESEHAFSLNASPPLEAAYQFDPPNEPVTLYSGQLCVEQKNVRADGEGAIRLEWLPTSAIRFDLTPDQMVRPDLGAFKLIIPELNVTTDAFLTRMELPSHGKATIAGVPTERIVIGRETRLNHVLFHLPNFHSYLGDMIGTGGRVWAGRAVLESGGWSVTLDAAADARKRLDLVAHRGGSAVTHVGKLERTDKSGFTAEECDEILYALQHYLSFVRGFWVSPLLPVGFDEKGNRAWEDWTLRLFNHWQPVRSWFPVLERGSLATGFEGFLSKWRDPLWKDVLQTALYWYLQGNTSAGAVDRGVVTSYVALESLADAIVTSCNPMPPDLKTATPLTRIASLCKLIGIPVEIPPHMEDLKKFADAVHCGSGPEVITRLRTLFLHPGASNRRVLTETQPFGGKAWQAWFLGLWYVELALLWLIGYSGPYANRVSEKQWVGLTELLPWSKG